MKFKIKSEENIDPKAKKSDLDVLREERKKAKKSYFDVLREVAEPLGWNLTLLNDNSVEIGKYSPAGEDFSFSLNGDEDYVQQIIDFAYNFDVDDHVQMWIGGNGAPSISRLVDDARDIQEMLNELVEAVKEIG